MSDSAALERRYRRLLACYPAAHRTEYGEEMIGVLLASTPVNQDRPTKATALDLIGGGLRIRFRRLRTGDGDPAWRDALAVFSVVAPVLFFIQVAETYVVSNARATRFLTVGFESNNRWDVVLAAGATALAAVVICPLLARRARLTLVAAAIAVIAIALAVAATFQLLVAYGATNSFAVYIASILVIEIVAVLASPGPGRGWQLLGRKGLVILAALAVALAVSGALHLAGLAQRAPVSSFDLWNIANSADELAPILSVVLIAVVLGRRTGGRLLALFAIPGYPFVGFDLVTYFFPMYWASNDTLAGAEYLPAAAIAVLVAAAAWWSGRRGRPRTPGAPG